MNSKLEYIVNKAHWGTVDRDKNGVPLVISYASDIEKDLEVLEILKRIVKIVDYSEYPITSLDNQLVILSGGEIKDVEDYDKIKEWLENDK